MTKETSVAAMVAAGGLVAIQAPLNAALARSTTGSFGAATVNFVVGLSLLLVVTFAFAGGFSPAGDEPLRWYYLLGGVMGAAYVSMALITVKYLGAGGVTAATIAGQLALSLVLDKLGAVGLAQREITPARIAGVALLAVGVFLVLRD